jgi:hypothetical protein
MLPIKNGCKQGDALSSLLFSFALDYVIKRIKVNQDGLTLNGALQHFFYVDDVNMLGGSVHTIKKNTETLVVAGKKIGLEVVADRNKQMVMSRDQNTGGNHNIKIENNLFERGEDFKYLGITLTDKNYIQEEIKSRLKSYNNWYHSVQNLLSSCLL